MSRSMSMSILVARNSAEADLLTRRAITRLVTCRRFPFSVTVTFSLSAAASNAGRFFARPAARVAGLALLEAGVHWRLAVVRRLFALEQTSCPLGSSPHISSLSQIVNTSIDLLQA